METQQAKMKIFEALDYLHSAVICAKLDFLLMEQGDKKAREDFNKSLNWVERGVEKVEGFWQV